MKKGSGLFNISAYQPAAPLDGGGTDRQAAPAPAASRCAAVTRFAPAPTGFLHIGHVVNAIFVWGLARALGGRVLLRIEDHDRQRCRPEYEAALLDDLDWLGFRARRLPDRCLPRRPIDGRQSDRDAAYREALRAARRARSRLRLRLFTRQLEAGLYAGHCRDRGLPLQRRRRLAGSRRRGRRDIRRWPAWDAAAVTGRAVR